MAQRFVMPYAGWINGSSVVQAGAKLFFYATGTTTPQNTYSDTGLTTPNANPVVADADGKFGDIFLSASTYKVVLKTSTDVVLWTADPVTSSSPASAFMAAVLTAADSTTALTAMGVTAFAERKFMFDVRDYGAVGNNSTDDAAAIQAAITAAAAGGIVFFPAGNYRIGTTLSVNSASSIKLVGAGMNASTINTVSDIALITIAGTGRHEVRDLQLLGVGIAGGTGTTCSSTSHVLWVKSTCVDVQLVRLLVIGGYNSVQNDGVDTNVDSIICYEPYGTAIFKQTATALWMRRAKLDNPWPNGSPPAGATFNAWAGATGHALGDVVSSGGFYLQCTKAGTTGGSAPTLQNYGTDITDGTATWRLACRTTLSGLEITTGASEVHVSQTDLSGASLHAVYVNNDGGGTAPFFIILTDSIFSQSVGSTLNIVAGSNVLISGNEIATPLRTGESGVALQVAFNGDITVTNNTMFGASGMNGIFFAAGRNVSIVCNSIMGWTTGVLVDAGVSRFTVASNNVGSSVLNGTNSNGITVTALPSDYYSIVNNVVFGAVTGVTDGGTGVNKTVSGNH